MYRTVLSTTERRGRPQTQATNAAAVLCMCGSKAPSEVNRKLQVRWRQYFTVPSASPMYHSSNTRAICSSSLSKLFSRGIKGLSCTFWEILDSFQTHILFPLVLLYVADGPSRLLRQTQVVSALSVHCSHITWLQQTYTSRIFTVYLILIQYYIYTYICIMVPR
jgi:hypothetical protein